LAQTLRLFKQALRGKKVMLTLLVFLLIALALTFLLNFGGTRYSPAFATRFRQHPVMGNWANILLVILGVVVFFYLLGVLNFDGLHSPFAICDARYKAAVILVKAKRDSGGLLVR
jgi:hypothetical protein